MSKLRSVLKRKNLACHRIAIVIGVMVACVSGMFGFGSVLREAAERSGNVVGFAKSQSLTYDSFNDSDCPETSA